jgi:hypothetical protein
MFGEVSIEGGISFLDDWGYVHLAQEVLAGRWDFCARRIAEVNAPTLRQWGDDALGQAPLSAHREGQRRGGILAYDE